MTDDDPYPPDLHDRIMAALAPGLAELRRQAAEREQQE